jgi:hypothetical protein
MRRNSVIGRKKERKKNTGLPETDFVDVEHVLHYARRRHSNSENVLFWGYVVRRCYPGQFGQVAKVDEMSNRCHSLVAPLTHKYSYTMDAKRRSNLIIRSLQKFRNPFQRQIMRVSLLGGFERMQTALLWSDTFRTRSLDPCNRHMEHYYYMPVESGIVIVTGNHHNELYIFNFISSFSRLFF